MVLLCEKLDGGEECTDDILLILPSTLSSQCLSLSFYFSTFFLETYNASHLHLLPRVLTLPLPLDGSPSRLLSWIPFYCCFLLHIAAQCPVASYSFYCRFFPRYVSFLFSFMLLLPAPLPHIASHCPFFPYFVSHCFNSPCITTHYPRFPPRFASHYPIFPHIDSQSLYSLMLSPTGVSFLKLYLGVVSFSLFLPSLHSLLLFFAFSLCLSLPLLSCTGSHCHLLRGASEQRPLPPPRALRVRPSPSAALPSTSVNEAAGASGSSSERKRRKSHLCICLLHIT